MEQPGGSTTVVTGAAGGIGRAVCRRLHADGHRVVAVDRRPDDLDHRTAALARGLDVADPEAVDALVAEVEATVGPIDGLVLAAGTLRSGPVRDTTVDDWTAVLHANATGTFVPARAVVPLLVERGRGAIVAVTSNAASTPRAGLGAYGASKAAAAALIRTLGLEVAGAGVRCNLVSPGSTETPMLAALAPDLNRDDHAAALVAGDAERFRLGIPLGRVAEPDDVAAAIAFLLSDDARHITLHDLRVDGGATLDA